MFLHRDILKERQVLPTASSIIIFMLYTIFLLRAELVVILVVKYNRIFKKRIMILAQILN